MLASDLTIFFLDTMKRNGIQKLSFFYHIFILLRGTERKQNKITCNRKKIFFKLSSNTSFVFEECFF